jgi:hypothetical protein
MRNDQNNDPLKTIFDLWPRLHPWQRKSLLIRAFLVSFPARLRRLQPTDIVLPATLAQGVVLIIAMLVSSQTILIMAVGSLLIVALAMSPILLAKETVENVSKP